MILEYSNITSDTKSLRWQVGVVNMTSGEKSLRPEMGVRYSSATRIGCRTSGGKSLRW